MKTSTRQTVAVSKVWQAVTASMFLMLVPHALREAHAATGQGIQASQVENQPNLMILLSNSASMDENMAGTELATGPNGTPLQDSCSSNYSSSSDYVPVPAFGDGSDNACGGQGSPFPWGSYGNQTDSRFYIAKETLYNLLQKGYANSINLGFATYRQAFGLEAAATSQSSNAIYPNIYLPNQQPGQSSTFPSPYNGYTFTQLSQVANNPLNFSFVSWWPVYNSRSPYSDTNAFVGNGMDGTFQTTGLFGNLSFLNNAQGIGGLPYDVSYPQGTLQNSTVSSGYWEYSYYGPGGLAPQQAVPGVPLPGSNTLSIQPEPVLQLCQTYYNSQSNAFQAIYTENNPVTGAPIPFQQSFPNTYTANTLYYVGLDSPLPQNGIINNGEYEQACNVADTPAGTPAPSQQEIEQAEQVEASTWSTGAPAYFSYIPNVDSATANNGGSLSLLPGEATGWSGATTETQGSNGTVSVTATYPSTPQPESLLGAYDQSGAQWMGAFVNLPSPTHPVSHVQTIEQLLNPAYPMENASGTEYHYSTQTITNGSGQPRSIANSSESASYDGHQEPLYNSLVDAYAYWKAFEQQDPVAQCQNNNMLVIFDGISDGDPNLTAQQEEHDLLQEASNLYNQLHVKIFVVIISTNQGDIAEANALAQAGGTGRAYTVSSSGQLYDALKTTLVNISRESLSTRFATTPSVSKGSYEFALSTVSQATGQGDLLAYQITGSGALKSPTDLQPSWDAESLMNASNRGSAIVTTGNAANKGFSSGSETTLTNLAANDPGIFDVAPNGPAPSTIAQYTIDPSYDNGHYLGGRQSGWYVGLPSGSKPQVVTPPDNGNLLEDPGYTAWAGTHSSREDAVLFTADDGLLYAIGYQNASNPQPTLLWAWMPQGFLANLQNYGTFWQSGDMVGSVTEIDAANANNQWHSYVLGSADFGSILYDLQLTGTGEPNLEQTVGEYDLDTQTGGTWQEPVTGQPGVETLPAGTHGSGETAVIWSETETQSNGTTQSGLMLMNAATGALTFVPAPDPLTSQPIIGPNGTVYVGAGSDVLTLSSSTVQGLIQSPPAPTGTLGTASASFTDIGDFANYPLGVSKKINRLRIASLNGTPWLVVQTSQAITAVSYENGSWMPQWASTTEGSGTYQNGQFTAQSASTPKNQQIPALPLRATVSDNALIVGSSVILPISVAPSAGTCGLPTAEYELYKLDNGAFPSGVFENTNGSPVTGPIIVGYGTAYTPSLSVFNGRPLIQASASNTNGSKTFQATVTNGLPLGGPQQESFVW